MDQSLTTLHPSTGTRERLSQAESRLGRNPPGIDVELTNNCNLMCAKCPTYETKRGRGFMSATLFRKIVNDLREAGDPIEYMALGGAGEALLHPEVCSFLSLARTLPNLKRVGFATNALGLTEDMSKALLDAGLNRIKISLDTMNPRTYLKWNRVDGFDSVVRHIEAFHRIRDAGGYDCPSELKVTLYSNDAELKKSMEDKWAPMVNSIRFSGLHDWLGLRGRAMKSVRTAPCMIPWNEIQILWNGQITLCCFDSMEGFIDMGNVADKSIADYWRTDKGLRAVREAMNTLDFSDHPVCGACTVQSYQREV